MTLEELFANETGPESCPICRTRCPTKHLVGALDKPQQFGFACPRCGPIVITDEAEEVLRREEFFPAWVELSGWCRDQQIAGRRPIVTSGVAAESREWVRPRLGRRADRLLRWTALYLDGYPNDVDRIDRVELPVFLGSSYSESTAELGQLRRILEESGDFRVHQTQMASMTMRTWLLTGAGRMRAEDMEVAATRSSSAFAAMSFDDGLLPLWNDGIRPGIVAAGFDPVRVDEIEHAGRIDDQIMLAIERSRFVVADFTGHRGGVYFEAGYALGRGLPVLWTCHEDDLSHLHFDIRQYNCLVWREPPQLVARLAARIETVVGKGPRSF